MFQLPTHEDQVQNLEPFSESYQPFAESLNCERPEDDWTQKARLTQGGGMFHKMNKLDSQDYDSCQYDLR